MVLVGATEDGLVGHAGNVNGKRLGTPRLTGLQESTIIRLSGETAGRLCPGWLGRQR